MYRLIYRYCTGVFFRSSVRMNGTLQIKYHTFHRISVVIPSTAFSNYQNLEGSVTRLGVAADVVYAIGRSGIFRLFVARCGNKRCMVAEKKACRMTRGRAVSVSSHWYCCIRLLGKRVVCMYLLEYDRPLRHDRLFHEYVAPSSSLGERLILSLLLNEI